VITIRALIKDLAKTKTVILSTHIMQEVEAICEQVIIINRGKIVADDNLGDLRKNHGNKSLEDIFIHLTASNDQ
jgi:ABC-2 type transport system ATP-binding protein